MQREETGNTVSNEIQTSKRVARRLRKEVPKTEDLCKEASAKGVVNIVWTVCWYNDQNQCYDVECEGASNKATSYYPDEDRLYDVIDEWETEDTGKFSLNVNECQLHYIADAYMTEPEIVLDKKPGPVVLEPKDN